MVIPAEIMHVLHANSLIAYLLKTCDEVAVVHLEDLFSDDVLQGVVLLLCTKGRKLTRRRAKIAFPHAGTLDLVNGHAVDFLHSIRFMSADKLDYKWMEGLLTTEEVGVYEKAKSLASVHRFADLASVDVGIVTGANNFFLVPDTTVKEYGLAQFAHPMFGRSSHVRGVQVRSSDIEDNRRQGLPSNFIHFPALEKDRLPKGARAYIELGEQQKLHTRYKCRIRKPWYVVPSVWAADVAMLKRAHDIPRLILNEARAYTTDTAYRIRMHALNHDKGARLVWNFVNSLTALSAELEGRHYGGGVIELVPSEIERLLIPFVPGGQRELRHLDTLFRTGKRADQILKEQDALILKSVGLSEEERGILHNAWLRLKRRRQRKAA
jgi:adenine-specific DNA methylase